jgi:hypothetical protein
MVAAGKSARLRRQLDRSPHHRPSCERAGAKGTVQR